MSALVNQDDEEHVAPRGFRPNQEGALDDLERQAVRVSPKDLAQQENQPPPGRKGKTESHSKWYEFLGQRWPFTIYRKQSRDKSASTVHPVQQCCFLCLRGRKRQPYAILVPCSRPRPRYCLRKMKLHDGTETSKREPIIDGDFESDSTVYKKLVEVCYQQQPKFKRWIPFYGIVDVREVKFRFLGTKREFNRCRVHIYPLNMDNIREKANETIAISEHPDYWEEYGCYNDWHSDSCRASMDYNSGQCMVEQIEAAQQRRNNLDTYYLLKDCARDPLSADNYETLKGMAQESPIIHLDASETNDKSKVFGRKNEMPGLEFVMGWQVDRIKYGLPIFALCMILVILLIWIVVIICGVAGEWSVSTAFGQIALASLAVLVTLRYLV